ncbi:hypothetical protein [Haloarcula sediminis]|uniref:hypothetical protein n=1 Tax=Haloarcula sediminis TaxID=3111777 RepID=UPI002D79DE56|nr:hypothetical protein [Haloarcula sp. CK38]
MITGSAGIAMAAGPTNDAETADTPSESDWVDGQNVTAFNASADEMAQLEAEFDSQNASTEIIDPESGDVIATYETGDEGVTQTGAVDSDSDGTNETWYYQFNVSHADLATMPMDAGENKDIRVSYVNNTAVDNPDRTNLTVTLENTNERAVIRAGSDAQTTGLADLDTETSGFSIFAEEMSIAETDQPGVGVNGTETDVVVVYSDDEVAQPYSDAAANRSSFLGFGTRDYESGEEIILHQVVVEDTNYAVYNEEAPEDVADNEDATYGTWTTVNGESAHVIELGAEDFEDTQSVEVQTLGNKEPGFGVDVVNYEQGGFLGLFS